MNFYIADCHFGDEQVIAWSKRPFDTVKQMDETMIDNWNAVVQPWDDVYIVGDFVHRAVNPLPYLQRLQGRLHLICGNHDRFLIKEEKFRRYFCEIADYKVLYDNHHRLVLFHYPMLEWDGYYYGTWHIYGHIHNHTSATQEAVKHLCKALNCGADITGFRPVRFDELVALNKKDKDRSLRPKGAV